MYIRVKRLKTTTFLHVEPTDTIGSVKAKLEALLQQPPKDQQLYKDGVLLEDSRSLAELRIETDDVLALALRQKGMYLSILLLLLYIDVLTTCAGR